MRAAFHSRPGDEVTERAKRVEYVPPNYHDRLRIEEIFARPAPLEVDIGTGEGGFLAAMARKYPDRNFLGMERLLGRVRKVCRLLASAGLGNVRMLRIEGSYAMRRLMPRESVSVAHIAFPDPWLDEEHQSRRLVQTGFLKALHSVLAPGGEVRVKTDNEAYFRAMEELFGQVPGFQRVEWLMADDYPLTDFEQRFLSQGLPIYHARLLKV